MRGSRRIAERVRNPKTQHPRPSSWLSRLVDCTNLDPGRYCQQMDVRCRLEPSAWVLIACTTATVGLHVCTAGFAATPATLYASLSSPTTYPSVNWQPTANAHGLSAEARRVANDHACRFDPTLGPGMTRVRPPSVLESKHESSLTESFREGHVSRATGLSLSALFATAWYAVLRGWRRISSNTADPRRTDYGATEVVIASTAGAPDADSVVCTCVSLQSFRRHACPFGKEQAIPHCKRLRIWVQLPG